MAARWRRVAAMIIAVVEVVAAVEGAVVVAEMEVVAASVVPLVESVAAVK